MNKILAKSFVDTLVVNLDNKKLSDTAFRQFCRDSVSIIEGVDYAQPIITPEESNGSPITNRVEK